MAATIPRPIPSGREISSEKKFMYSVTGILVFMISQTGTLMFILRDVPQSPSKIRPFKNRPYWTVIGLSRLYFASRAALCSWVISTASSKIPPGISRITMNPTVSMINIVSSMAKIRWIVYFAIRHVPFHIRLENGDAAKQQPCSIPLLVPVSHSANDQSFVLRMYPKP